MNGLPRLVGVSGLARAGKDTAAAFLVQSYGYQKVGFADALRACAHAVNPIVGFDTLGPVRWSGLFNELGYEAAKDHPEFGTEFRRILLAMGTEMGRDILGEDVWVNATLDRMKPGQRYVVADVRFPNEAAAITERGGVVLRVQRRGLDVATIKHASETSLDDWEFDAVVRNDGLLGEFHAAIDSALWRLAEDEGARFGG